MTAFHKDMILLIIVFNILTFNSYYIIFEHKFDSLPHNDFLAMFTHQWIVNEKV